MSNPWTDADFDAAMLKLVTGPRIEVSMPYPHPFPGIYVWPYLLGGHRHGRAFAASRECWEHRCIEFPVSEPSTVAALHRAIEADPMIMIERYYLRSAGGYAVWVHQHHAFEVREHLDAMAWDENCWPNLSLCECTQSGRVRWR